MEHPPQSIIDGARMSRGANHAILLLREELMKPTEIYRSGSIDGRVGFCPRSAWLMLTQENTPYRSMAPLEMDK
jgi:hypothetical protein